MKKVILAILILSQCCVPVALAGTKSQAPSHHLVRHGETLYTIARRYHLDYHDLAKRNRIRAPYALKPGQKLRIATYLARKKKMPKRHIVRRGETLYAIAWRYDLDYRDLAKRNQIRAPFALKIGQSLRIAPYSSRKKPVKTTKYKNKAKKIASLRKKTTRIVSNRHKPHKLHKAHKAKHRYHRVRHWKWPTKGKLVKRFSLREGSKGIDIAGWRGQPIRATAAGKVAYAGSGLRGYGLLLILKHNNDYLSAYAHNRKLLVREGQWIKVGQKIAEMGNSAKNHVMLHFEIRRAGKPVNPLWYLRK